MNEKSILETLRNVGFLRGLAEEHLEKLAEVGKLVDFPEGKIIFREGEPSAQIFLIVVGKVSLEICAPGTGCKRVFMVSDGGLLGWSPVLEQSRLTATARTLTATQAIELNGRQIMALCQHNPHFGCEFMRRTALALAKRLDATREQLLNSFGTQNASVGEVE